MYRTGDTYSNNKNVDFSYFLDSKNFFEKLRIFFKPQKSIRFPFLYFFQGISWLKSIYCLKIHYRIN